MSSYTEKLRDPRWQKKRLEALQAAGWACENCGGTTETLNVHHKRYFKGRMPWEYELEWLSVLCENCHTDEHFDATLLDQVIASSSVGSVGLAAGITAGYLGECGLIHDAAFLEQVRQVFPMAYWAGRIAALWERHGKNLPFCYDLDDPFPNKKQEKERA